MLTIEVNQPRSVLFYLPGDVVKRDVVERSAALEAAQDPKDLEARL